MAKASGFITLHRKIMDWEWYDDPPVFCLFVHLLLIANYADGRFHGKEIKRGQVVTSLNKLATNAGLSIQQTRTALDKLISTGEVTNESTPNYRVITIVKYDDYQTATNDLTNDQQTINKQSNKRSTNNVTSDQQQYNNNNKYNKGTNKQGNNNTLSRSDRHATAFSVFWATYPKKVCKADAEKAWKKIPDDVDLYHAIMNGLSKWKQSEEWQRDGGRYIPHAATWLNGKRWEDDIPGPAETRKEQKRNLAAQDYSQRDYSDADQEAMALMLKMGGYS